MLKIRQHSMIVSKRVSAHPIFNFSYLAENIASFIETILFIIIWCFLLLFFINLLFSISPRLLPDNALTYIFVGTSEHMLGKVGLKSDILTNLIVVVTFTNLFFLVRIYFEHIKYNLHVIRNPEDRL